MSRWEEVFAEVFDENDETIEVKTQCHKGSPAYSTMNCPMGYPADPPEMDSIEFSTNGKNWEYMDEDHPLFKEAEKALWEAFNTCLQEKSCHG